MANSVRHYCIRSIVPPVKNRIKYGPSALIHQLFTLMKQTFACHFAAACEPNAMQTTLFLFLRFVLPGSIKKVVSALVIAVVLLLVSGPRLKADPVQWTIASGGNGHYYDRVAATNLTYTDAVSAAAASTYLGMQGHLLILDTANVTAYTNERDFVFDNVFLPGQTANRVFWIGASLPTGGTSSDWMWVDGTSVPSTIVTSAWLVDHNEGAGPEGASFYDLADRRVYDYIANNSTNLVSGYIIEYQAAIPEPGTTALVAAGLALVGVCWKRLRVA